MERGAPAGRDPARRKPMALSNSSLARQLEELIAALDRRRPNAQEAVEIDIARDAAALRAAAVEQLTRR